MYHTPFMMLLRTHSINTTEVEKLRNPCKSLTNSRLFEVCPVLAVRGPSRERCYTFITDSQVSFFKKATIFYRHSFTAYLNWDPPPGEG